MIWDYEGHNVTSAANEGKGIYEGPLVTFEEVQIFFHESATIRPTLLSLPLQPGPYIHKQTRTTTKASTSLITGCELEEGERDRVGGLRFPELAQHSVYCVECSVNLLSDLSRSKDERQHLTRTDRYSSQKRHASPPQ